MSFNEIRIDKIYSWYLGNFHVIFQNLEKRSLRLRFIQFTLSLPTGKHDELVKKNIIIYLYLLDSEKFHFFH